MKGSNVKRLNPSQINGKKSFKKRILQRAINVIALMQRIRHWVHGRPILTDKLKRDSWISQREITAIKKYSHKENLSTFNFLMEKIMQSTLSR